MLLTDTVRSTGVRYGVALICWLSLTATVAYGQADAPQAPAPAPKESEFLRLARDDAGAPVTMQTSIVRFAPAPGAAPAGLTVDLVSAVHIADAAYFEQLNTRFRDYDAVLYELVAPEGTRVPLGGGQRRGVVSGIQGAMTNVLDLTFQLEQIDYTRANFVHADLSPEEFAQSMAERGETMTDYLLRAMTVSLSAQAKDPAGVQGIAMLMALLSQDRDRLLKIQFAVSMLDMETMTAMFEGKEGSTLIAERNERAVSVLQKRIEAGDRRLAIFYGAGHMADMAKRLESDLGLRRTGAEWLDAWDLR
jgi:hypothetical protein